LRDVANGELKRAAGIFDIDEAWRRFAGLLDEVGQLSLIKTQLAIRIRQLRASHSAPEGAFN